MFWTVATVNVHASSVVLFESNPFALLDRVSLHPIPHSIRIRHDQVPHEQCLRPNLVGLARAVAIRTLPVPHPGNVPLANLQYQRRARQWPTTFIIQRRCNDQLTAPSCATQLDSSALSLEQRVDTPHREIV